MKPALVAGGAIAWVCFTVGTAIEGDMAAAELAAIAAVGVALAAVGLVARLRGAPALVSTLAVAAGLAWLVSLLRYSEASLPWTISLIAPLVCAALLAHLAFAYPTGVTLPGARRLVATICAVTIAGPLAIAAFARDPASQGYQGFPENLVLVGTDVRAWETLNKVVVLLQALLAAALLAVLAHRWVATRPAARRGLTPALAAGVAAALLLAAPLLADGPDARSIPWLATPWDPLLWAIITVFALVPVTLALGLLGARLARSGVADLVIDLDRSHGSDALRGALVRTLRDPSLTLALWDPTAERFHDTTGATVELPPEGSPRAATILEREGRRVGALVHDSALRDDPALIGAAAAAVRIALENDQLQDELRVQLAEVRASRARIVEAGDTERRRLERDLHDGAQQKLVSLSLALQLAERRAAGDDELLRILETMRGLTRDSLADVRAVAHGLHPPILREEGLKAALDVLARTAPLPVRIVGPPDGRLEEPVEVALYFVASEALANVAKYAGAGSVTITSGRANGRASIDVVDDGGGGADPSRGSGLRGLADRVAALDGHLEITSPVGGGTRVHAEIPIRD